MWFDVSQFASQRVCTCTCQACQRIVPAQANPSAIWPRHPWRWLRRLKNLWKLLSMLRTGQGLKYLTLTIVTRAAYSTPSRNSHRNTGNAVKFFTFTEVSGLIYIYNNHVIVWLALARPLLLILIVHYPLLDLSDCRFNIFYYQKCFDSSMWRIMWRPFVLGCTVCWDGAAQLGFYHCKKVQCYPPILGPGTGCKKKGFTKFTRFETVTSSY